MQGGIGTSTHKRNALSRVVFFSHLATQPSWVNAPLAGRGLRAALTCGWTARTRTQSSLGVRVVKRVPSLKLVRREENKNDAGTSGHRLQRLPDESTWTRVGT